MLLYVQVLRIYIHMKYILVSNTYDTNYRRAYGTTVGVVANENIVHCAQIGEHVESGGAVLRRGNGRENLGGSREGGTLSGRRPGNQGVRNKIPRHS